MSATLGSAPTILVVDDEPAVLILVQWMLEAAGYDVLAACDGRQALALLENQHDAIDLLLTDINMPDMTGFDVMERLQADEATRNIPVVICTSRVLTNSEKNDLRRTVTILNKEGLDHEAVVQALRRIVD